MTVKFTVKCPKSPSGFKNLQFAELENYGLLKRKGNPSLGEQALIQSYEDAMTKTDQLNSEFRRIRKLLKSKLNYQGSVVSRIFEKDGTGKQITGTIDGCLIVTCDNTVAEVEQVIGDLEIEIMPDESRYKIFTKGLPDGTSEEDIDEIFEPLTVGEKKKLKSRTVPNQFKIKSGLVE